ncbi:MAG: hypothetical protein QOH21_2625 [Acidobacteriota bacterium]|nr:hypothetical protein [Acidobacteriota bacterium]
MHDDSVYAQTEFRQWLTDGIPDRQTLAASLIGLPPDEREGWLADHPAALNYHTFEELLEEASLQLDRDAIAAEALTAFIVAHVDRVTVPPDADIARLMLLANAWRERGNALHLVSDLPGMEAAYLRALELADSDPALAPESAALRRGLALVEFYRGNADQAVAMIRAGLPLFRETGDLTNVLKSLYFEAYIEYGRVHDEIARAIFIDILDVAEEHGDRVMQARAHLNLGHCNRRLRARRAAIDHFTASLPLLQECGMTGEIIRVEWGIALLGAMDDPAAALPVLDRFRDEFLATGRIGEAAWASLDTVTALHDAGHEAEARALAIELFGFFASHNMPREAMQALSEIRDAALEERLTAELLETLGKRVADAF